MDSLQTVYLPKNSLINLFKKDAIDPCSIDSVIILFHFKIFDFEKIPQRVLLQIENIKQQFLNLK